MKNKKEILVASSNLGKIKEFKKLFNSYQIFSLNDFQIDDPIEDGDSFLENALKKAKHGALSSGMYTIADDSGLVVPDLNFEPGIYSARYAGDNASDKENRDKIINKLHAKKVKSLDAYYVCILVGIKRFDDPMPLISEGKIYGKVSVNESGNGGFGYDRIFYPNNFSESMASISPEIKNEISHRAIATNEFLEKFNF